MSRVKQSICSCITAGLFTLLCADFVFADFSAYLTIETTIGEVTNQVRLVTRVKGEWRRRELHGEGLLKDFLGHHIEITNRLTGVRVRIYPESEEFVMDTTTGLLCGPFGTLDLNLLGSIRSKVRGTVETVDTAAVILGGLSVPVDIVITSRYGGTYIRFWMCEKYAEVFGAASAAAMDCGSSDSARRMDDIQAVAALLQQKFRLSDEDADVLKLHLDGYPMRVESVSQTGGTVHSVTTILTDSLVSESLPDSLFLPPVSYRRR